jgi:hypothetical protein
MAGLLALAAAATGCNIEQDTSICEPTAADETSHFITVEAHDNLGKKLSEREAEEAVLYVFGETSGLMETRNTVIGQRVEIMVPTNETVKVVAWCNLMSSGPYEGNYAIVADMMESTVIKPAGVYMSLNDMQTRAAFSAAEPGDLFLGSITIPAFSLSGERELPTYREMGSMIVTVRGLQEFMLSDEENYTLVVGNTLSSIAFDDTHFSLDESGDTTDIPDVFYPRVGEFDMYMGRSEWVIPTFRMMTGEDLTLNIMHGNDLVLSVTIALDLKNEMRPIDVYKGMLTNVLIDITAGVDVSIVTTDWDAIHVWKDYNS